MKERERERDQVTRFFTESTNPEKKVHVSHTNTKLKCFSLFFSSSSFFFSRQTVQFHEELGEMEVSSRLPGVRYDDAMCVFAEGVLEKETAVE